MKAQLRRDVERAYQVGQERTRWIKRLEDQEILKCGDRERLRAELEAYLEELTGQYVEALELEFPSALEWKRLGDLSWALARLLGKRKADLGETLSAWDLIANRYSKIRIRAFTDGLMKKFTRLPVPPRTTIYHAREACKPTDKKQQGMLDEIYTVVGVDDWSFKVDSKPWDEWLAVIQQTGLGSLDGFVSDGRDRALGQELSSVAREHPRIMGYLVCLDLHRQHLHWLLRYEERIRPTVQWISSLQDEAYDRQLRQIVHGDAPSPWTMRASLVKLKRNARRRRHYQAGRPPKRAKPNPVKKEVR
jgi:hypothetical protein